MTRRVTTSRAAAVALKQARQWLCQPGSGPAGLARWQRLERASHVLRDHPCLGSLIPRDPRLRQLAVAGYRPVYRVTPDTGDEATAGDIRIVQVFGPGQQ